MSGGANTGGANTEVTLPRAARPDLRLLAVLAASWLAAAWGTAADPGGAALVAAALALAGALLAVPAGRAQAGRSAGAALLVVVLAGAVLTLASAAAQTAVRTRAPLPEWIAEGAVVEAWGSVAADPHRIAASSHRLRGKGTADPRYTVRMQLAQVSARGRTVAVDAPVLVFARADWAELTAGQHLTLTAKLDAAEPGDDVVALARAIGPPRQVRPGGLLWRLADRLRDGLRAACDGLPADAGGLLPSLVVGDTSRLPDALRADLQTAGLTHVTAVSGANGAIVAGAVLWAATGLGLRRSVRLTVALAIVGCFVVVARPQPSVLRAAVMGSVALLGVGLSRRPRGLPALGAAGTVLLVVDPWLSRSAGFALSCLATAALLLLAPAWTRRLARRLPVPVAAALAVPAAAQAACGPVVVLLTPAVSIVAVPANLLAGPAVAPATVAGVLAAVTAPAWPGGGHALAWAGSLATGWIARVAHVGASLPLATLPWPTGLGGALLLAALTGALVAVSMAQPQGGERAKKPPARDGPAGRGGGRAGRRLVALGLAVVVAGVAGWWLGPRVPAPWPLPVPWPGRAWPPTGWAVTQCDVGQGASTVIRSGPDRAVLVDTGPVPEAVDGCLRRLGVRHLDLVLLTHHHADHVFGLPGALHRRDAASILVSPLAEPADQAAAVRRVAAAAGVPVTEGWGGMSGEAARGAWSARWRLLAPVERPQVVATSDNGDGSPVNEASVVIAIDVTTAAGALRVVALGDLETDGQQGLLRRLTAGQSDAGQPVDVLVVAHHGSARQVPGLCRLLRPRVAVIGVGAGNDYGHPAPSALAMLRDCGAAVYRTDLSGNLALVPTAGGRLAVAATNQ